METKDSLLAKQTLDEQKLKNNLLSTLIDNVLSGKNTCVLASGESLELIESLLSNQRIQYISEQKSIRSEPVSGHFLELELERYETFKLKEKFKRYLLALNDQRVNGISFVKLLRSKTYTLPFPLSFTITNQFTFAEGEFIKIKQAIELGANLYAEEFDSISKNGLKSLKFTEASEIEEVLTEYQSDLDRLKDLHARYSRAFNTEKFLSLERIKSSENDVRKVKDEIEKLLYIHKFNFGEKDIPKPGILSMNKLAKESYESWKYLIEKTNSLAGGILMKHSANKGETGITKILDIENLIGQLNGQLENWWSNHQRETEDRIKRINHINLHAHTFTDLYAELSEVLRTMTAKSIYARDLECNARSSIKQLEYLDETILSLSSEMSDLLRIPLYFKWKNFLGQQDLLTTQIFKDLTIIPKSEWVSCFTTNYTNTYCEQQIHSIPLFAEEDSQTLRSKFSEYIYNFELLIKARFEKEVSRIGETLAASDKKLFKKIESGLQVNEVLDVLNDLNFPIVVASNTDIKLIEICKRSGYSILNVDEILENNGLYILKPNAKISEIPVTEQITVAKELAKGLLAITRNIKIYQLQFANIICTDDGFLPTLLIEEFKKYGIKEFSIGNYGEDHLIESIIMTDRPQYLILRDGMVNTVNINHIGQQLNTINAFESAGYKIVNIWTSKMKEDAFKIRGFLSTQLLPVNS